MTNKLFFTFLLSTFLVLNSFAQRDYDRIIFNDSTIENCIIKSVQIPMIQYNTYNIETKKEGAMRMVNAAEVARVEYADGHAKKTEDLLGLLLKTPAVVQAPKNSNKEKEVEPKVKKPINTKEYTPSFIIKTDLANDVEGFINVGLEKSLNRHLTFEGFLGYAGQNKTGTYYFQEDNNYYEFDANLKSGGLFSMAAVKWYPCVSSRRMDFLFHTDGIDAAPHGWNLALREQLVFMQTKTKMTYTNSNQQAQSSGGLVFSTGTTLDLGYQQSNIFKILSFEIYGGLGYLYRNSAAVNIVSPGGVTLPIIPRVKKIGLATSWGFTVGVDLAAFKRNL